MEAVKICLFCVGSAILYGVLHDQITAHVCVEYFSVGHPTILPLTSPFWLAMQWGIVATWWVGLSLGILLAAAARLGNWPRVSIQYLRRPILALLMAMAATSTIAGLGGFLLAANGKVSLVGWLANAIPPNAHARFIADWWAHSAAYLIGIVGGLVLCVWIFLTRRRLAATSN